MKSSPASRWVDDRHRSSVTWIVALATLAMTFDGYDLVVYGTIVPVLMNDSSHIGEVTAQQAGALGSYALIGVLIGALLTGAVGDFLGRRKMLLTSIVWFSLGMAATATAQSVAMFGVLRLLTGIGVGALIVTSATVVAEFAPADRKNLYNAIVFSGFALGGVLASVLAMLLRDPIGWRGMFLIGTLPLVVVLPLALAKLPESPRWLIARGKTEAAQEVSAKAGVPLPSVDEVLAESRSVEKVGFSALLTRRYVVGTALIGFTSFSCLILVYALNTWLPKVMENAGYDSGRSLTFLLLLNGGAMVGCLVASRLADRHGPKRVIASMFGMAALALITLTLPLPLPVLFAAIAVAGAGTTGTQIIIYGFVANYYMTNARAAGMAWCAGFGRLGGIFGPLIGGVIIGAGLSSDLVFYLIAGIALFALLLTVLVPRAKVVDESTDTAPVEPARAAR